MNINKGIFAAIIVAALAFLGYRYSYIFTEQPSVPAALAREVSVDTSYPVPNGEDFVRFTLALDENGAISGAKLVDSKTNEPSPQMLEFSKKLLLVIKGKKLSELTAVDKVGTSSLTTAAFNSVIDEFKDN